MSATSTVAKVTATLVGRPLATITTVLPPAVTQRQTAGIFDPHAPSPIEFSSSDPLALFIVQAFIIVALSRILHFGLRYARQPRVISEIVAGVLLGPTAFGRIPNFTSTIFPAVSVPYLNLVANIGLTLFLFLIGMEIDLGLFRRNAKVSTTISAISIAIPFALGAAVATGVYRNFIDPSKSFGIFILFVGTAFSITAMPVLSRILLDENLIQTNVGVIALSAGIGNDVVGWLLLALAICLANAASGLIVLYTLLTCIAWILVLWFVGRPLLKLLGRKTRSSGEWGPSQTMTVSVVFAVLASAWFTDKLGIHAIFGAFLVGLIVPKDIRSPLTEKIEDLVSVLFLPIYFALSGFKTDLTLLNTGKMWAWTICIIVVAFASKFLASGGVAKAFGMTWRESGAVGSLMACKGLVELIVLNIGLNAGVLNLEVFAMFVLMALITTFITSPLTLAFYPPSYRLQLERERNSLDSSEQQKSAATNSDGEKALSRFAIVLEQLDHFGPIMDLVRLVKGQSELTVAHVESTASSEDGSHEADGKVAHSPSAPSITGHPSKAFVSLAAFRLVALTERTSALLHAASSITTLLRGDVLSSLLRSFAAGLGIPVNSRLNIISEDQYSYQVAKWVEEEQSEMVVIPWSLDATESNAGNGKGKQSEQGDGGLVEQYIRNPLEGLFGLHDAKGARGRSGGEAASYATFARRVFAEAPCNVSLFLETEPSTTASNSSLPIYNSHIVLPFHGGSDDRECLRLLLQLVTANPHLSATVLHIVRAAEPTPADLALAHTATTGSFPDEKLNSATSENPMFTVHGSANATDTMYPTIAREGANHGVASEAQDDILLGRYFSPSPAEDDATRPKDIQDVLKRITYEKVSTAQPLQYTLSRLSTLSTSSNSTSIRPLIALVGRSRLDAPSHTAEITHLLKLHADKVQRSICVSTEVRRALGDQATACVVEGSASRVWVVQAKGKGGKVRDL
ncbi:uncharacterized protein JCM15063_002737 [Sporobolomyces koalae]|uniref:uncharacterized protein n=1 Tax=Sporobolomyces koalae TaxID=500713 RepID=UPI00317D468E